MTTVIWNGRTLVADSMVTDLGTGEKSTNAVKIKLVKKALYKGEQIQAVACAGWFRIMGAFWDIFDAEVTDESFFKEMKIFKHSGSVIIVTATKVINVEIDDGVVVFNEHPRSKVIAIGSGAPLVGDIIANVAPELLVAYAMQKDPYSGGSLTIWDGEDIEILKPPVKRFLAIRMFMAIVKNAVEQATAQTNSKIITV